jgi:hypothetical protein
MEREEEKNLSFPTLSSYPASEYNPLTSLGNSSATIVDQGTLPH